MGSSTYFIGLLILLFLISCNDEKNSSTNINTDFAFTGSGQNAVGQNKLQKFFSTFFPSAIALTPPMLFDAHGSNIHLNEAWIVVKKIQFKTSEFEEQGEANDSDYHYQGPFYVDLLSDDPMDFGHFKMPAMKVRRVKMLLHKGTNLPKMAPMGLKNKSIYINGSVNGHSFVFADDDTSDFSISGSKAIVPENGKDFLAVVRMANLFLKIDLSSVTNDIFISPSSRAPAHSPCPGIEPGATDLYTCIRMGLESEAKFGKDDGNKDLDANDKLVN